MGERSDEAGSRRRMRRIRSQVAGAAKRLDQNAKLVTAAKLARELLPGDSRFGDPLSTAGSEQPHLAGRRLSELTAERPGFLREAGLSALQVWQGLSEAQGRGRGHEELAILFTDLVDFSEWALEAGDAAALDLLRDVGQAIEPSVNERGGRVVKWLGDGMMAVFGEPQGAFDATVEARHRLAAVEADGYDPRIRAGIHLGRPRKVGGDYLGVDVNVAARLTEEASPNEVLVSEAALARVDASSLKVRKKRFFRVKGVPRDVSAYSVAARDG
jgi:adenylate cyclase